MRPTLAYLPSPSQGVWLDGYVKAYALCIVAGIIVAVWIGERRWVARGGQRGTVSDIAIWAVVFGLIGGRIYHVITDWELYFGDGRHPIDAVKVWKGGLGIWGAISAGGLGAYIGCRQRGVPFRAYADAVVPGVVVAQAIGRWGNWFNQELFGRPTTLPWGLEIDADRPDTVPGAEAYHPTFLYESLWDLGLAGVLIWADRRFRLGRGRVLALYMMGYPLGRVWVEALRIDNTHHILGLRLNIWTCLLVFLAGLLLFVLSKGPREIITEPARTVDGKTIRGATGAAEGEAADGEAVAVGAAVGAAVGEAAEGEAAEADAAEADADEADADEADAGAAGGDPGDGEATVGDAGNGDATEATDAEVAAAGSTDAAAGDEQVIDDPPGTAAAGTDEAAPEAAGDDAGEPGPKSADDKAAAVESESGPASQRS